MMEKVEGCTVNFITVKLAESGCCSFRLVVQSAKLFIHFLMFKKILCNPDSAMMLRTAAYI